MTAAQLAELDAMLAAVRNQLNFVVESAERHLKGADACPHLDPGSNREQVIAHLCQELFHAGDREALAECLAMAVVELAEQRMADSV